MKYPCLTLFYCALAFLALIAAHPMLSRSTTMGTLIVLAAVATVAILTLHYPPDDGSPA